MNASNGPIPILIVLYHALLASIRLESFQLFASLDISPISNQIYLKFSQHILLPPHTQMNQQKLIRITFLRFGKFYLVVI